MAADGDDNPGVLGNLPRSRPGQRSTKRGSGSGARKPRAASPARSSASSASSAKRSTSTAPKRPAGKAKATPPPRPRRAPGASSESSDPLGQAVELAGKVATVGLRTAVGIVKRLPRP